MRSQNERHVSDHLIDIRRADGDDAICSGHIDDWKCLVLQSGVDVKQVEMTPGNDDWDAFILVPWRLVEEMNGDLTTYVPMLITFAYKMSHR